MVLERLSGISELAMGQPVTNSQRQRWTTKQRFHSLVPVWELEENRATTFLKRQRAYLYERMHGDPRHKRVF